MIYCIHILYLMRFVEERRGLSGRIEKQKEREMKKRGKRTSYAKEVRPKNQWCNSNLLHYIQTSISGRRLAWVVYGHIILNKIYFLVHFKPSHCPISKL